MRRMLEGIGFVSALLPAADVYETADEFVVELEVPGYEENEISIEISDQTLRVTGERAEAKEEATKTFRLRERLARQFDREFELPPEADARPHEGGLREGRARDARAETSDGEAPQARDLEAWAVLRNSLIAPLRPAQRSSAAAARRAVRS